LFFFITNILIFLSKQLPVSKLQGIAATNSFIWDF